MSFEEKLIEAVRGNPILYDLKNKNYRRVDIKEKIWRDIAHNLKSSEKNCKTRWKSLRDAFKRAHRVIPSGSAASDHEEDTHKKWKYFDLMSFLYSTEDQNDTVGNYETPTTDCDSNTDRYFCDKSSYDYVSGTDNASGAGLDDIMCSTALKKKRSATNDIHTNFKNFLDIASKTVTQIDQVPTKAASSTSLLFSSLALKIDNTNLLSAILNDLEMRVSNMVYDTIREHNFC